MSRQPKLDSKRLCDFTSCTTLVRNRLATKSYCSIHRYGIINTITLREIQDKISLNGKHPSWKNSYLRNYTKSLYRNLLQLPCAKCGYTKHVELCHIKPLSKFPLTATLAEVSSQDNIIQLCPNCHWELDNII